MRDVHPRTTGGCAPSRLRGPQHRADRSLASYARVNRYGFIETPYRKVVKGKVLDRRLPHRYRRGAHVIAQANAPLNPDGSYQRDRAGARRWRGRPVTPDEVDYMDVSPKQLVSVSTALIPFLEHDDANRALMGSNMQRQAVPLLRSEARWWAPGSRAEPRWTPETWSSRRSTARWSRSAGITSWSGESGSNRKHTFPLGKFVRSNQGTCMNQKAIVREAIG